MKKLLPVISLILFFLLSLSAIAVAGGYIALPEKSSTHLTAAETTARPAVTVTTTAITEPPADDDPPDTKAYVTSLKNALVYSVLEGLVSDRSTVSLSDRKVLYYKLTAFIKNAGDSTPDASGIYSPDTHGITLAAGSLYDEYTCGTEVITTYEKVYGSQSEDASYVTHSTATTVARYKTIPYMGYLLTGNSKDNGEFYISLCDSRGNVLVSDLGGKLPYLARDYSNFPVFTDASGSFFSFDGAKFIEIGEERIRSELFYDYPAVKLAAYDNKTEVALIAGGLYRYTDYKTGKYTLSAKFVRAFNFASNGLAVALLQTNNEVRVYNSSGKTVLQGPHWQLVEGMDAYMRVDYTYMLPDTLGIESIGCSGFDNGWLRIRARAVSVTVDSYGVVKVDNERLINEKGEYLDLPEGYTLEGYSNGVALLSKNGLYGFYSVNGYWIAQPIYTYARPFIQGLAVIGCADGTVGMIDTEGSIVLPFMFTHISDVSSGVISAYVEGIGWNIYNLTANNSQAQTQQQTQN